ncbi:iron ABC transporter permease [Marinobacter sp. NFXS9]|uniref:FecCD family ABC transporter permease n=1 Tax=Marinobacter sp. NFXS9 TaxID=2818433 RepID=UPI0032DF4E74
MNPSLILRSGDDRLSLKIPRRTLGVVCILAVLLIGCAAASLSLGSHPTSLGDVASVLAGSDDSGLSLIVGEIRLPRVLLAILAGASLGVAGLLLQGLVRNPLASPDVIGITSGASAAAVAVLTLDLAVRGDALLPLAAITGAFAVALVILALTGGHRASPVQLVLVGVGLASALGALITFMLVFSGDASAMNAYLWLTGSLYAAQWGDVIRLAPWLAIFLPVAMVCARQLDVLALGDPMATGLGASLSGYRPLMLLSAVALAGSAVSVAGGLSFIGLVAPHMARNLVRGGHTGRLVTTAFLGALILLCADMVGRLGFAPRDLPAGVFVAAVGAPYFVYQLYRLKR